MSKSPTLNPIKTALIGFGASGKHLHLPLLSANKHYQLVAVCTHRSNVSNVLPQECSQRSFTQVLTDSTIELVVIATPNNSHFELAQKALESGKHVVVEKPIALHSKEIEILLALAKQQDRLITSFHNRLWDCDFMAIKRLLTSNQLGNVHSYAARVDRYQPDVVHNWRDNPDSGGAVWELAPNLIVQTLTLFGMPNSVFADITTLRKKANAPDNFYLRLSYPSLNVELRTSWLIKHTGPRFVIHGDGGSFIKQGIDQQHQQLKDGLSPADSHYGQEKIEDWGSLYTNNSDEEILRPSPPGDYDAFYRHLFEAIKCGTHSPSDNQLAVDMVNIIEASYLSNEQQRVIEL